MGVSERKEREKRERRAAIVDAAERLFFERGYTLTTMDDIARVSQLAKGTLYLYAKNKEELFHAVALRGLEILLALCDSQVAAQTRGIDKVMAYGQALTIFYRQHTAYFLLMSSDPDQAIANDDTPTNLALEQISVRLIEQITSAIQVGKDDGTIRSDVPPKETALVLAFTIQAVLRATMPNDAGLQRLFATSAEAVIAAYFSLIQRSLSTNLSSSAMNFA